MIKIFNTLKHVFCIHSWIPIKIISTDVYNKYDIRYARCYSICSKCGKKDFIKFMMNKKYQDRW